MRKLMTGLIRAYRYFLSPLLGSHCRFYPSCSQYALDAIDAYGPWTGLGMTLRRLGRCHPWHEGGYDPIPLHTNHCANPIASGAQLESDPSIGHNRHG